MDDDEIALVTSENLNENSGDSGNYQLEFPTFAKSWAKIDLVKLLNTF